MLVPYINPPAPASGVRHEMSCGLLRLALDTRCLAGSSAAGCAASSCRETCASSSDSSATPYPLGLAVFLDEEPVPVAAARAGTVPWATAARRSAPDARHLLAPCPCLRHLRAPCPCLQGPAPAGMGDGFEMPLRHEFRAKEATYVASPPLSETRAEAAFENHHPACRCWRQGQGARKCRRQGQGASKCRSIRSRPPRGGRPRNPS